MSDGKRGWEESLSREIEKGNEKGREEGKKGKKLVGLHLTSGGQGHLQPPPGALPGLQHFHRNILHSYPSPANPGQLIQNRALAFPDSG